jgi:selenocysteine lyase/cysteine desulfurase
MGASEKEIAFTTNTSHGMNLVAQLLKGNGDMITMQDEFPSTTVPWLNQGVHVQMVSPVDGRYPLETIEKGLTPQTKILVTSYVQYNTGFRQDLEALGKFCREKGLIFVVNATQALPVFPVDVKKMHIDFLVFTGLKWATAGYGIGCLYISDKYVQKEKMPFAGWLSVHDAEQMNNTNLNLRQEASMLEGGCPHFPNIFALGGALDLFNRIGKENAAQRVLQLNRLLIEKLQQKGFELASPTEEKHMSGITIVKVKNPKETVEQLREKNIIVSARGEGLRISVSVFNNEGDVERGMEGL